jgi:uncharacterized membrane protein YkgB
VLGVRSSPLKRDFNFSGETMQDDEAKRLFVGQKYPYYADKWAAAEQKRGKQTWNWAAFFLGFGWMVYRKMYKYTAIFIAIVLAESYLEYLFDAPDSFTRAVTIAIAVTFGWQGNTLYKMHVDKKVQEITSTLPPEPAAKELASQGGTNLPIAIGSVVLFIAVILLIAFAIAPEATQGL